MPTKSDLITAAHGLSMNENSFYISVVKDDRNSVLIDFTNPDKTVLVKLLNGKKGYQFPGEQVYSEAIKFIEELKR